MSADSVQEIDISGRSVVVEKEASAEVELFHLQTQLSTSLSVPIRNTFSYLVSKAASVFPDGKVQLYVDGEMVGEDKSLEDIGVSAGAKKRVEVRYAVEEAAIQDSQIQPEAELVEIDPVKPSQEDVSRLCNNI